MREKEEEQARSMAANGRGELQGSNDDSMDSSTTIAPAGSGSHPSDDAGGLSPSNSGRESVSQSSEASTPRAPLATLPKNVSSPTTTLPSSPLRAQSNHQDQSEEVGPVQSRERPVSTASSISKYSATGWDDYNGVVRAMDWGEDEGKEGDGIGDIIIGGPETGSTPRVPADESGNESEKERSKTPTLVHSSNPSTSSSNSADSSNHPQASIRDSQATTRLLDSYPNPSVSHSPDPDTVSIADTEMHDYEDLGDTEGGNGSGVQLMTATKIHSSPQGATLVRSNSIPQGQTSLSAKTAISSPTKGSRSTDDRPHQMLSGVGAVGLGLGLGGPGSKSPSTSSAFSSASSPALAAATAANAIAVLSSPIVGGQAQSSEASDRPATGTSGGSHGSFGTAKTSFSPSVQQHPVSSPIGLGLGSPVVLGNPHTVTTSTGTSATESSTDRSALSPSSSSGTPFTSSSSSPGGSSPSRRKARPAALKLSPSNSSPINSTTPSPAITPSRSLSSISSPKSRTNHPPRTNPPAEPLPPLPLTPSLRQTKGIGGPGTTSPANSSPTDQFSSINFNPNSSGDGINQSGKEGSPRRSSAGAVHSPITATAESSTKVHSRSQSQGAAAALRSQAATNAAATHAQAVLKAVETPPSFNEKSKRREMALVSPALPAGAGQTATDIGNAMVGLTGGRDSLDSSVAGGNPLLDSRSGSEDEDSDDDDVPEEAEVAVLKTLTHAPVRQSLDGNREKSSTSSNSSSSHPPSSAVPVGRATVTRVNSRDFNRNPSASSVAVSPTSNDSDVIKPPRASLENLGNSRIVSQRLNGSESAEGDGVTVGQVPGPKRPIIHSWARASSTGTLSSSKEVSNSASSTEKGPLRGEKSDKRKSTFAQQGSWPISSASNTDTSQGSTPVAGTLDLPPNSTDSALDDGRDDLTSDTVIASPLTSTASTVATSGTIGRPPMVRRRSSAASLMSNRRLEMEEDRTKAGSTQSLDPLTLKRTESRFTGAFGGEFGWS